VKRGLELTICLGVCLRFRAMFMTLLLELPGFAVWKASRGP
jgi:hypothetical protein